MRALFTALVLLSVPMAVADIQTAPGSSTRASGPVVSVSTKTDTRSQYSPRLAGGVAALSSKASPKPKAAPQVVPRSQHRGAAQGVYPWRLNITATVFWVGEDASARNPVDNHRSSWDGSWRDNFGGFDNPDPESRIKGPYDYRPKNFKPKQNPFYVALPYNDVSRGYHKAEAAKIIPWFNRDFEGHGKTVCKGKWVQIIYNNKSCFAQWEDCGPFTTEDWHYVFGDAIPQNKSNKAAGIDISPAVRDYLGIKGGTAQVHWRFVEFRRIPKGPWALYGENNPFVHPMLNPVVKAEMARIEKLKAKQMEAKRKALVSNPLSRERSLTRPESKG